MDLLEKNDVSVLNLNKLLADCGIKCTSQRMCIAQLLLKKHQHLTAEQVFLQINTNKNNDEQISMATVYNTLHLFSEKGLIREVIIDSSRMFYDSNTKPHHHFFNEDTGMLADINADEMILHKMPELPNNTVNSRLDIIIRVRNNNPLPE